MADVAQLGIRVDSAGALKAVSDLDRLTASAGKADVATDRLATSTTQVSRAMSPAAYQSRQVALQLSQVAQQGQVTGNYLQALAVQLPDMATGFGAVGIAAGVLASVALPLVVGMFTDTGGAAKRAQESLDALADATKAYSEAVKAAAVPIADMTEKYGRLAMAARGALEAMAAAEQVNAINALRSSIDQLTGPLVNLQAFADSGEASWYRLADALGVTDDQANGLSSSLMNLANAKAPESIAKAAQVTADRLLQAAGSYDAMSAEGKTLYTQMLGIATKAAEINGTTESTVISQERVNQRLADAYGLYAALRGQAAGVAAETERAAAAFMAVSTANRIGDGDRGGQRDARRSAAGANTQRILDGFKPATPSVGGGVSVDPMQSRIEALRQTLSTEREIEVANYATQQEDLRAALESKLITQTEYHGYLQQAEAMHAAKMAEIKQNEAAMVQQAASGMYGALEGFLGAFAGKSKAAAIASIALNKALSIASIIQNTGAAATRALAELGPIAGPPAAAKILAFGKVQAALVAATGLAQAASAGGGGGSLTGTRAAAQSGVGTAKEAPIEYIVKGLDRDARYTGAEIEMIFEGIAEEANKRGLPAFRFI